MVARFCRTVSKTFGSGAAVVAVCIVSSRIATFGQNKPRCMKVHRLVKN
jgi:hypothetical protein